jgi:cysteine sulfinate desulfinase/cysteine desulfurase-like protein
MTKRNGTTEVSNIYALRKCNENGKREISKQYFRVEGRKPLEGLRHRCEDNINTDLTQTELEGVGEFKCFRAANNGEFLNMAIKHVV